MPPWRGLWRIDRPFHFQWCSNRNLHGCLWRIHWRQFQHGYAVVNDLLNEAYSGRLEIVTSSFALVEVLRLKGHEKITEKAQAQLVDFFEFPFIKFVNADREVCELSRRYVWRYGMKSKDAVHMATADVAGRVVEIYGIFSWDSDFVNLNGKEGIRFPISHPFMSQPLLRLGAGGDESDDEDEGNPSASES